MTRDFLDNMGSCITDGPKLCNDLTQHSKIHKTKSGRHTTTASKSESNYDSSDYSSDLNMEILLEIYQGSAMPTPAPAFFFSLCLVTPTH